MVDDDLAIRSFVQVALEDEGYEVHTAADGKDALTCVAAMAPGGPDAVLLDMNMPRMNGWQFAAAYRATEVPPPHGAIIVMTAATDAAQWCRDVNGDACLGKPFDLDDLYRTVEKQTRRAA